MTPTPRTERGPAATSGASDIGAYGATPALFAAPVIALPDDAAAAATSSGVSLPAGGSTPAAQAIGPAVEAFASALSLPGLVGPAGTGGWTPFATAATAPLSMAAPPAAAASAAPDVPQPEGQAEEPPAEPPQAQGSGTPPGLLASDAASPTQALADAAVAGAQGVPPAILPSDLFGDALPPSLQTGVGGVEQTIETVVDALEDRIDTIDDRIDGILQEATETVDATVDRVTDTTGALVDTVTDHAGELLAGVGDTVDNTLTQAGALTGGVTATVGDLTGGVTDTLTGLTGTAGGLVTSVTEELPGLDDLGGSDPAGGITTLVGMVSAADVFGLHDAAADPPAGLGDVIADTTDLIGEIAPGDVLLGTHDDDGALGLLDGLIDGHHA